MKTDNKNTNRLTYDLAELEKQAMTISRDFTAFCDYVIENNVKLAKKTGNIGKKDCFTINTFLHVREKYETPSYFQNQYSIINFFYYIATKYKILEKNSAGTGLRKGIFFQCFREASLWEQYILFLTVFMFDGTFAGRENSWYSNETAGMWRIYVDSFMEWVDTKKPCAGCKFKISKDSGIPYLGSWECMIPYYEELNLIKVWRQPDVAQRNEEYWWEIEVLPLLEMVSDVYENTEIEEEGDLYEADGFDTNLIIQYNYEVFAKNFIREKQCSLLKIFEKPDIPDQERMIDLEVSVRYTDCIRVIRMNMENSLYDLHCMIQQAVEFDNDHLFEFIIGKGMLSRIYTFGEVPLEKTKLEDLELCKGQKFTYLFDFGDMWWFDIRVLEIQEGFVEAPEVIKSINEAPEQYPGCEEDVEEWEVVFSDQVQISDILASIDDALIREEYAALTGMKNGLSKETPAIMRQDMERILLQKPDRMLTFMPAEMRNMLLDLLQNDWVDESEVCRLAKLYSFGFCQLPDGDQCEVLVPEPVKEIYLSKIKTSNKKDKIAETAETFLKRCGVMEMQRLYSAVAVFLKSKISYEEFDYLIYGRLHYFGEYYCDCYGETEYISCYNMEITQKILEERQKPENRAFDYPDFGKIFSKKKKEAPKALKNWIEYVEFDSNFDWQTAEKLMEQIPAIVVSGVVEKKEIVAMYKEMLRGTGCRVTKKAENLIEELCRTMPLATKKGNTGLEEYDAEGTDSAGVAKPAAEGDTDAGPKKIKDKKPKEVMQEEYRQFSIFEL